MNNNFLDSLNNILNDSNNAMINDLYDNMSTYQKSLFDSFRSDNSLCT